MLLQAPLSHPLSIVSSLPQGRQRQIQNAALGAVAGAWMASVLVLMDWGDDWLTYPTPAVLGAVAG